VVATISADNVVMQELCEELGFRLNPIPETGRVRAEMEL